MHPLVRVHLPWPLFGRLSVCIYKQNGFYQQAGDLFNGYYMWAEIWIIRMRVPSSKCIAIAVPSAIVPFDVMFIILPQKQYVII